MEKKELYYVTMTDKFLSGWGRAEGKTHKQVVVCKTREDACRVIANIESLKDQDGMRYLNMTTTRPYYNPARYTATFRNFEECPLWNK